MFLEKVCTSKVLVRVNLSPQEAIDTYGGVRSGSVKADFYDDCSSIPDPADLNVNEKNLLILDDCFLGPQNKAEAYYTRGRHVDDTWTTRGRHVDDTWTTRGRHILHFSKLFPSTSSNDTRECKFYRPVLARCENICCTFTLIIVMMTCLLTNSKHFVERHGTVVNTTL